MSNTSLLRRSVIALPLLEEITRQAEVDAQLDRLHPPSDHPAAVFLKSGFRGGVEAALQELVGHLAHFGATVHPSGVQRLEPDGAPFVFLDITPEQLERLRHQHGGGGIGSVDRIWPMAFEVIIDINLEFQIPIIDSVERRAVNPDPRREAKTRIINYIDQAKSDPVERGIGEVDEYKTELSNQYVFARLDARTIKRLVEIDREEAQELSAIVRPPVPASRFRTIHHVWPDFPVATCVTESIRTIKVDAAHRSFTATGEGITWAVMDTGIQADHPHFRLHGNIDATSTFHRDFCSPGGGDPLSDPYGHGTHVAGIIAGEQSAERGSSLADMRAFSYELDENEHKVDRVTQLRSISGMAPRCRLISLKVLDDFGMGKASSVMAAIAHVQLINGHGRHLKIHGVNLSLGHSFDPKWFACGHSPLCVEVNRLVHSGVVVVIAAGNTGYGTLQTNEGACDGGIGLTINDPGNAEHAITVGSTHRDKPHMYGVSYFSSKGPTGDGRHKPDLVAPGEKIVSCAVAGSKLGNGLPVGDCAYFENSGTSMAAPHVSGAIAAFLSIRGEFKGEALRIKEIFTSTATDLGRNRDFQGTGLVDLMRAIQSI